MTGQAPPRDRLAAAGGGTAAGATLVDHSLLARVAAGRPQAGELARLAGLAAPTRGAVGGALLLLLVGTSAALAVPWLLSRLLDDVLGGAQSAAPARIDLFVAIVIGALAVRALCAAGQAMLLARAGERTVRALRQALYDHLLALEPAFHDDRRLGELVSRLFGDTARLQSVVTSDVAALAATALTLGGALALLAWRSWRLTAVVLALVPLVVVIGRLYGHRMRRLASEVQDRTADATSVAEEALGAVRLVQAFAREPYERQRFVHVSDRLYAAVLRQATMAGLFGVPVSLVGSAVLVVTLWFGAREVVAGRLTAGDVVALAAYGSMVGGAASSLVTLYGRWSAALGASRRVFALMDRPARVADGPGLAGTFRAHGRVSFEAVCFRYGRGDQVLTDIELDVRPGETLALVGPSGAGKSTLVHLVARFYDPTAGRLCLDGIDLRTFRLAELRASIALVPQDPLLFNASVADNLRYGRLDADDGALERAARAAHAHAFVSALPDGYATIVGERGVRLSTGERQRLSIARALLRDPRVLLLDEATASLDSESEQAVQAALSHLLAGRTSIVIAHRLSTVRRADRIAVLEHGRIVELGAHDALMAAGGLYARLHELQFAELGAGAGAETGVHGHAAVGR